MMASDISVIRQIMRDDVAALTIWVIDHPDFKIDFEGHSESALTLACAANATQCVNSMILRGIIPDAEALSAAVQTGNTALIRKVDSAANSSARLFSPFQTALLMEMSKIAAFFARKQPELSSWHKQLIDALPQKDLSTAYAFGERAVLENIPEILVVYENHTRGSRSITEALAKETVFEILGSRKPEMIKQIILLDNTEIWKRHDNWTGRSAEAPGLWAGLEPTS
jgi:hypothetical protein